MTTTLTPSKPIAESKRRAAAPTSRPSSQPLAIDGGPRAVTSKYRERWRRICLPEAARICWNMFRDVNTESGGSGAVATFETKFAKLTHSRYALAMNSGTAALHSAYFAVGVGPGDEVIVPSYTFFATAAPVLQCGATPVFCEIDPETLTADPEDVRQRITARTRAICVLHPWGNPARMDQFAQLARQHDLALIEDASHAHGASYQGKPVGSWGDIGCFSLQGAKPVSGGEGGIAVTDDPALYDRMLALGHYPRAGAHQQAATLDIGDLSLGLKYRPHLYSLQLARGSLSRLAELNRRRRHNYGILEAELSGCAALTTLRSWPGAVRGGLLEFIVQFHREQTLGWDRESFAKAVRAEGVPIRPDRYEPLHRQKLFAHLERALPANALAWRDGGSDRAGSEAELPITEEVCRGLLSLPPLTRVSGRFVRQCGAALRKVADHAMSHAPSPSTTPATR